MLTVVVIGEDAQAVAETLAAVMPGVLDGLVSEAAIVAPAPGEPLAVLAEEAGCALRPSLAAAAEAARGVWLLVLPAGARPETGWIPAVRAHLARSGQPARFGAAGFWERFTRRGSIASRGLLLPRAQARLVQTADRAQRRGLTTLPIRLLPAREGSSTR